MQQAKLFDLPNFNVAFYQRGLSQPPLNIGIFMKNGLFILLISLFSTVVHAHPGHDHQHWFSSIIHLVLALSVVGVLAIGVLMYRHKNQLKNQGK